ncbi:unnamed protein product [Lymnaea stagnalis]|uniref:Paraoxonase n=1 Tax=Lymnaea stagnalis TaxID=6523 RepID=A0AAV2H8C9_LYMST
MILKALLVATLAISLYSLLDVVWRMGFHLHYHKHYPGKCSQVKGVEFGSEDLQVTSDGLAFITSGFSFQVSSQKFKEFLSANDVKGQIVLFDFNKPDLEVTKLKISPTKLFNPDTFRPHGISVLEDKVNGQHLVYVINHPDQEADRVEKFRYLPHNQELFHLKSFSSETFRGTNDLAVLEEDKFFISNYFYYTTSILTTLENLGILKFATVVYFNGTDYVESLTNLQGPNGVTLSRDGRYLYVNFPLRGYMQVYERTRDNQLDLVQTVPLFSAPDNSHLSTSGNGLFIGIHPITYQIIQHLDDPLSRAPSSVLYVPLADGKAVLDDITQLFYDHGDLITGSTIAAVYNNKLIIGSIIDKLVVCQLGDTTLFD